MTGGGRLAPIRAVRIPGRDVRRDQMASFLARTLALLVDEGAATPPE